MIFDFNLLNQGENQNSYIINNFYCLPLLDGCAEAEVLGGVLDHVGGAVASNVVESVTNAITGGDHKSSAPEDRPQTSLVTAVLEYGSFQLKSGKDNTMVENSQYVSYSKSDPSPSGHDSLGSLLSKEMLIGTVQQRVVDDPNTVLYSLQLGLNPLRDQQVTGAIERQPPYLAIGKFFQYWRCKTIRIRVVPVATQFHMGTVVLSAQYYTLEPQTLQQVSNQIFHHLGS